MIIGPKTRVYAVIGSPVRHSLSPAIHNRLFAAHGLDAVYVALEVSPSAGPDVAAAIRTLGLAGANLTLPHKQVILPHLDSLTPEAEAAGAVNTVYLEGERLVGHNTDSDGFLAAAEHALGPLRGRRAWVLGAGGAGAAVVSALLRAGASEIVVWNRDPARASALIEAVRARSPSAALRAAPPEEPVVADLIVNATSSAAAWDRVALDALSPACALIDLNYWQAEAPVLTRARAIGHPVQDGLPMLAWQAALAFERFTGHRAEGVDVLHALRGEAAARIG